MTDELERLKPKLTLLGLTAEPEDDGYIIKGIRRGKSVEHHVAASELEQYIAGLVWKLPKIKPSRFE